MYSRHGKTLVLRYKNDIITMTLIGVGSIGLFSLFFPGDEAMKALVDLVYNSAVAGLFQGIGTDSPGWVLWMSIVTFLLIFYIIAFAGINLGATLIPTVESDGIDTVLTNSSITTRKLYLRNYLGGSISLILILLPIYGVLFLFSWVHDSLFILDELAYSFAILLVAGIFIMSLVSTANILRFSKPFGKAVGYGYLIFGFLIDLLSDSPDYADYANLSISHYLNPVQVVFTGLTASNWWEIWKPSLVMLGITALLGLIGMWRVEYPDYLERVKELRPPKPNSSKKSFKINLRLLTPDSFLGRKFPLFTNQLRRNMSAFLILLGLVSLMNFALFRALPSPGDLITQLEQGNTPIYAAFAQNHTLPASLLGFIILKFYDALWLYYGIVVAVITSNLANRDVRTSTHDILFANNISPARLIFTRLLSFVVSFSIFVWGTFFIIRGIQTTVEFDLSFSTQAAVFTVLWVHYLGMGVFLVGLSLIPLVSKGKNVAFFTFIGFILLAILPFLNPDINFLKYFSYLNYFDPVGLVIGEASFPRGLVISMSMLFGSTLFTYLMIKLKYARTDFR